MMSDSLRLKDPGPAPVFLLQFPERGRISGMIVEIDDKQPGTPAGYLPHSQHEPEDAFGRNQIPFRRQQDIDCISGRINGPI